MTKTLTGCRKLAGSALQDARIPSEDYNLAAVIMPVHYLIIGNLCYETNKLKIHPREMATKTRPVWTSFKIAVRPKQLTLNRGLP